MEKNEKNILIIGYGTVGKNLLNELQDLHPDVVDKYKSGFNTIKNICYDLGFICVDTPLMEDQTLNIEEVINCINDYDCEIYCIKSTCPVGTFYNVCKEENINYSELRELFILDHRINPSHTFVYKDTPYWDSHCLNKDVPAIANQYDMTLLKSVIDFNKNQKQSKK